MAAALIADVGQDLLMDDAMLCICGARDWGPALRDAGRRCASSTRQRFNVDVQFRAPGEK